ncbi:MAG: PD-(D/E)XK nuclease family protein [Bacteroidales bacterium]|nr:PD-(D/E)XK nuclease family protein [Bacteroidales bacterium]
MKNNFLYQIAKKVYEHHQNGLGDVCIVFPNKRAGLFFSRYLSEITDKPVWSPVFMTIRELMQEFSGLQLADPLYLIFELYNSFRQEIKSEESFDEFYHWGEMLLGDFDEVDKYLISAKELFRNLSDLKEIENRFSVLDKEQIEVIKQFWKWFEPKKKSVHQEKFVSLWEVLYKIYSGFKNKINNEGLAYEGMLYKQVAEKILNKQNLELKYSSYIIVGFNAMSKAEDRLFEYLRDSGKAEFYWDWDQYYLDEGKEFQEAGFFISKNRKKYPSAELDFNFNYMLDKNKKIEFIGVPSEIGQAKILEQVFRESHGEIKNLDHKTAIVLPDEHLLMPVIYSLPEEISNVNITMGYPVKNTPVYGLVCNLIELQRSLRNKSGTNPVFYFKHVLPVLYSHYIQDVAGEEVKIIEQNINSKNIIYWSPGKEIKNTLLRIIFSVVEKVEDMSPYLLKILEYFHKQDTDEEIGNTHFSIIEREYIYNVYTLIKRLDDIITAAKGIRLSIDIYYRLLNRYMHDMKIPFSGEPLSGLQIMGILETRTLDFENVVILSMNEGIFPRSRPRYSFIPFNLRKGFGLPTIEHQDSIYAYYFYRLIQRARNISLIYDTSSGGLKTGEMSRFLTQMKYDKEIKITERILGSKINIEKNDPIRIFKTEKTLRVLSEYIVENNKVDRYISPTALNIYLDCSLKFYFKYIAQLKEPDEVIEEIDPMIFGNLLHHSVNLLYKPYVGKIIDLPVIKGLIKNRDKIKNFVNQSFIEIWFENDNKKMGGLEISGKSIVIRDVLLKYVITMLETDLKYAPFRIIELEKNHWLDIPFSLNGIPEKIRVGGRIDRIDMVNGVIRVIDYKTGATENEIKMVSDLFSAGEKSRKRAVLQIFIYALMLKKKKSDTAVIPGIYSVRDIHNKNFDYRIFIKDDKKSKSPVMDISDYEVSIVELIKETIEEIYDTTIPFLQVDEPDICKYCPYKQLCSRDKT